MQGGIAVAALVLSMLAGGCVAPASQIDPASLAALDSLAESLADALPEAVPLRLDNGDLQLTLTGEIGGSERFDIEIPEGVTFAEADITSDEGFVYAFLMTNRSETFALGCSPQTWSSWAGRTENGMRCSTIPAADPAPKWVLSIGGGISGSLPTDLLPVPVPLPPEVRPTREITPIPFELTLTFSTQPLDGPTGAIKLESLSRSVFEAMEMEVVDVPASSDGAGLHVEITRPKTEDKVPIMLRASPYNGPAQNAVGRSAGGFVDQWVARGYAVAVMDLRGTGKSDGCFSMRGEIDEIDVADVVEFLGTQEWSTGKVGMHGVSYEGYTPMAAAVQQPPHLAAIYIGAPAVDTWSNYLPGGVDTGRSFSTSRSYMQGNAALTPADELPPDAVLHTIDAFCDPTILPRANDPRHLYDAWYAERNLTADVANVQVPVLFEQGFWDNNVKSNMIPDLFHALNVPKRAHFGSWQHTSALRADGQLITLAWFDHWLKDIDNGVDKLPAVEVLTNTREWRAADTWPSPEATMMDFEMGSGAINAVPPALQANYGVSWGFESESFEEKVYWTGVGLIDMTVTLVNGGNVQLEARVYEIPPEGDPIFAGVGWINAAHRNGHDTFAPFAPGESAAIQMKLLPQDHVLQPGSKLAVELRAASDYWGGVEAGLNPPTLVEMSDAVLHIPTLPTSVLSPEPRSAS